MTENAPDRWRRNVSLRMLTTWRIGGPAAYLASPSDLDELREDIMRARQLKLPVLALGSGSNLLFPDTGYPGVLIRMIETSPRFATVEDTRLVWLSCGAPLSASARALAGLGWSGLEWAEGIPGTVGGAVVNNAGAYGGCIAERLHSAKVLLASGALEEWPREGFGFEYRRSALKGTEPTRAFIIEAAFDLTTDESEQITARMAGFRAQRAARTPCGPSCGSVFRNPSGQAAGKLIAEAGLAGHRIGDAQIAAQHANYIINIGRARAQEVLELIALCKERVRETCGVELELEVQLVGLESA